RLGAPDPVQVLGGLPPERGRITHAVGHQVTVTVQGGGGRGWLRGGIVAHPPIVLAWPESRHSEPQRFAPPRRAECRPAGPALGSLRSARRRRGPRTPGLRSARRPGR